MSCTINLGTGQAPGVANHASDPVWKIFDIKRDVVTGPAVLIGNPKWGAAPTGLHWIATQPGPNSGGDQYLDGNYAFQTDFYGDEGVLTFRVKADNAVKVYLGGTLLLDWGDPTGVSYSGWQSFSPLQTVTSGLQTVNTLTLILHNNAGPLGTYMGVLFEGQFERSSGSPAFIQSTFGTRGNFEMAVPHPSGGIAHYYRDNDHPSLTWHGPTAVFGSPDAVGAVSMIQSHFNNLEVVARIDDALVHFYRDSSSGQWFGPFPIATGVHGTPSLIEDKAGNFQVAAPVTGGIARYYRDNSVTGLPWSSLNGVAAPPVQAVSMIQSTFGGNLEIIARMGNQLGHFFCSSSWGAWQGPYLFASAVVGAPAMIQSRLGAQGNFEVITPLAAGGFAHFWRDNASPAMTWHGPTVIGTSSMDGVALIQSNYNNNLEFVATIGCYGAAHFYRTNTLAWFGPNVIVP